MKETLDALKALQASDKEIREFLLARDELKSKLMRLSEILARGEEALDEKRVKLADAEKWYREKNQELKADIERVKNAKTKLTTISRTKDYIAAQKELEHLRKSNSQKEEEILKLLDAIEEFKSSIGAEQGKLTELREELAREKATNAERLSELDGRINEIESKKDEVRGRLSRQVVTRYERIIAARDGLGVVEVRDDGTCLGCNRRIPPQMLIELLKFQSIMNCPACNRFIFVRRVEDEAQAQTG